MFVCLFVCLFVCWLVGWLVGCVKIHSHFPRGCSNHFTIHTYLYTLAQGKKVERGLE